MEKIKAIRGEHRSAVTRHVNRTGEKIAENDISNQELCATVETLEKKRDVLQDLDNKIIDITEVGEMEQEILDTDVYTFQMEITIRKFKDILLDSKASVPQQMVSDYAHFSSHHTTNSILNQNCNQTHEDLETNPSQHIPVIPSNFYHRLPKLDLPTFSGDILAWQTFWDSFQTTVHTNPSLTNVQKFSYLKSQIVQEAEQCISGLALTSANYEQAIHLLKERFGQKQNIINAYMQNVLELPSPSLSPTNLRHFYDKMETSIRGLESLGQSQDTFGSLVVPIIFGKLSTEMRKSLTREHCNNSWNIKSLREPIGKEAYVQEAGNFKMSDTLAPTASFYIAATPRYNTSIQQNGGNKNKINKVKLCVFCQEPHFASDYLKVATNEKRYAFIKQKNLCFNCFGSHKISECTSKYTCRKCYRKHHTSLCHKKQNTENQTTRQTSAAVNTMNSEVETHTATDYTSYENPVKQRTDVLFKTAVSQVSVGNNSTVTNILLNEGSQQSFITEDLAKQLQLKPCGMSTLSLAAFGETNRNVRNLEKAVVHLETIHGGKLSMEVLIVPTIAAPLSNRPHYEVLKLSYLQGIELAHPMSKDEHFDLAMLIGADYYWDIVENDILRGMGPTAVKSKLGYLLYGPMPTIEESIIPAATLNVLVQHKKEGEYLELFWKLESAGVTRDESTKKDKHYYETYESTLSHRDNHYRTKLPCKENLPDLSRTYNVTKNRISRIISRLSREPEIQKLYSIRSRKKRID